VKQMTANRPLPEGDSHTINLPLFLVTLTKSTKSQEIFKLNSLCHIVIRLEAYRAQNGLTRCFNCRQLGHVWANRRQPPHCCGVEAATRIRSALRRRKKTPPPTAATAVYRKEMDPILPATEAAATQRRSRCGGRTRGPSTRELQGGRSPPTMSPPGSYSQQRCEATQGSSLRRVRRSKLRAQQQNQ
jgi:hypothetical protein